MSFCDNLISEGKPIIFPYNPSDNGDIVFERWKTKIKFFHKSAAQNAKEKIEEEVNEFLKREDRIFVDIKFNCIPENFSEKVVVLLIYKERVE